MVRDPAAVAEDIGEELVPEVPAIALAARDAVQVGHDLVHQAYEVAHDAQQPAPMEQLERVVELAGADDKAAEDLKDEGQKAAGGPRKRMPLKKAKGPQALTTL